MRPTTLIIAFASFWVGWLTCYELRVNKPAAPPQLQVKVLAQTAATDRWSQFFYVSGHSAYSCTIVPPDGPVHVVEPAAEAEASK